MLSEELKDAADKYLMHTYTRQPISIVRGRGSKVYDLEGREYIDFVGGIRGTGELQKLVDSGKAAVAFSMHPVTVEDLMRIADAGEIMPPKSTWFEPKLRDGLLSHLI